MIGPKYQKVAIWGSVAMGKTTLANILRTKLQISNIIYTDDYLFSDDLSPNINSNTISTFNNLLLQSNWIIDGNLGELIPRKQIIENSELVMILNLPFHVSLRRMIVRDTKSILDVAKYRRLRNFRKSMNYIFNSITIFFESVLIIKKYKKSFFNSLIEIAIKNNLTQKVIIIRSQSVLDKYLENW